MRKLTLLTISVLAALMMSLPAQAGFRIGPRLGVDVSSLRFNKDVFNKENRAGFTGGLQMDITFAHGFGIDASVMYATRDLAGTVDVADEPVTTFETTRRFINVPVNLKWKMILPFVGHIFSPYIFTGPDFAYLLSSKNIVTGEVTDEKKYEFSWNVGIGIELFKNLQISATYGMGITNLANIEEQVNLWVKELKANNNNWTITAAWLF